MIKKTVTFEDYNGKTITEDFFFNLSKAELVEMELSQKGGLADFLKEIVASDDGNLILEMFKKIVLLSYGKKSEDGRRFIKTPELREEFEQTGAYSELFIELATNADAAAAFVNGVVPAGLVDPTPSDQPSKALTEMTKEELLAKLNAKGA
jgi:hypothetical protein